MVQKKLPLQTPHAITTKNQFHPQENLKILKPPDLKTKKMKKSGSFKQPNYMKPTTSFDARKEVSPKRSRDNSSITKKTQINTNMSKASRGSGMKKSKNPIFKPSSSESQRATCSSTLKDSKFPDYLSLNSGGTELEGTSIIKVCPYTYCSLNGHRHASLPPLKHFISARRRAIKVQRNMKLLGCLSPRRVKDVVGIEHKFNEEHGDQEEDEVSHQVLVQEETKDGFLDEEIQVENTEINVGFDEQDSEPSDMEWEMEGCLGYDYEYECPPEACVKFDLDGGELVKNDFVIGDEESIIKSDKIDESFDDFSADEVSQESFEDEGFNSDTFSSIEDGEIKNPSPVEIPSEEPSDPSDKDQTSNPEKDQETPPENFINTSPRNRYCAKNEAKTETEDSNNLVLVITKGKDLTSDMDESGQFNPRAPNFLPLEPDPEAEKVDLKHQDLDERKNADEWMVDYALRQVVTKLGPARKRKVALLVEAFEKVTPVKKCELHLRHVSGFNQAMPMQTCS